MTALRELPDDAAVVRVAQWLADRRGDQFGAIIPVIKTRFGLTSVEAAEACTLANTFRTNRRAFG